MKIGRIVIFFITGIFIGCPNQRDFSIAASENAGGGFAATTTETNSDTIMKAFNEVFYVKNGDSGYFKSSTTGGHHADFWKLAEEIEMVIDAFERSGNAAYKVQIGELMNGFVSHYGSDWTGNHYNDDIMWMCIASLRAYQATGNADYRDRAKSNFDACYARAWDVTVAGGGMWWTIGNSNKNACVNAPAAIAACFLAQAGGDSTYTNEANAIIDWTKSVLSDGHGKIYDSIGKDGRQNYVSFTYNQGTYIGACNLLGRVADAAAAANYTMNFLGTVTNGHRILPQYRETGDSAGFNGIFLRWMSRFMRDRNLQDTYLPWLQANAAAAWNARRLSDNISWCRWLGPTPANKMTLQSWSCSPTVVALQVVPPPNAKTQP